MTQLLLLLASIAAIAGLFQITPATMGIGLVAIACLLGIFARVLQAEPPGTDRTWTALAIFIPIAFLAVVAVIAYVQVQLASPGLPHMPGQ